VSRVKAPNSVRSKVRNSVSTVSACSRLAGPCPALRRHTQTSGPSAISTPAAISQAIGARSYRELVSVMGNQRPGSSHEDEARSRRSMSRLARLAPAASMRAGKRIIQLPIGSTT
jgi:hypothetical protein